MSANAREDTDTSVEVLTTFEIKVCPEDGRLLREYTLNRHDDGVYTLSDVSGIIGATAIFGDFVEILMWHFLRKLQSDTVRCRCLMLPDFVKNSYTKPYNSYL